ncbi:DUF1642 domain-containing protein [Streptococcus parasanguinis]|uniref:DUF1642 domain-containing protein n=1 Tax=Streptococcus parasanguinis TaxID=1318 RepID=UPI00319DDF5E
MDDCTKVLVYGSFDGFTYSTDDLSRIVVVLDDGERVEVPKECVISADQMVNKYKIKLKDVIARIKKLDFGIQEVWLNEILNELGSDYGTLKYKDGYEQGKFEGEWVGKQLEEADKVRQELNKPVVEQFVADWYEEHKDDLEFNIWDWIKYTQEEEKIENRQFTEWLGESENKPVETLVKMKLYGYTVEKEPKYTVKIKGKIEENLLVYGWGIKRYFFARTYNDSSKRGEHTRKELEEDGFGWVFDCPGMEVEEVE